MQDRQNTVMTMVSPERAYVFVHGLLGFNQRCLGPWCVSYFRHLQQDLVRSEIPIHFPDLPATGTIKIRATALAAYVANVDASHITLIGHSMGGLDSRYLITHIDPSHRIDTLISIATPHHGTTLADWIVNDTGLVPWLGRRIVHKAARDMMIAAMERFNETVPDRQDVRYLSFAGSRPAAEMPLWLRPWSRTIEHAEGANDGLVSVRSARWGSFKGILRAHHAELVGWPLGLPGSRLIEPFDALSFYRNMVKVGVSASGH